MNKFLKVLFLLVVVMSVGATSMAQDSRYAQTEMSRTDDGGFVLGNPDAPVKLIEFADFLCPHCQNYKPIVDTFIGNYVLTGQAQFEYRMLPIVDANLSAYAANLVECADSQSEGLFWDAHDLMYELTTASAFTQDTVTQFMDTLELDEAELNDCVATADQYISDITLAQSLGITGTPTVLVQYGDSAPLRIALPTEEHFELLVNATRPVTNEPVLIESGRYEGIQTYRSDDGGIVLGDPDAPLTLVAFEDFMCPHCQNYQPTIHTFIENYVATGQAKFEYRFYPLVNPDYSMLVAQVADCVALQDLSKFWDAHDYLFDFASTGEIDDEIAPVIAMLAGVDADAVVECVDTSLQPLIDIQLGQQSQVTGTPGIRARGADGVLNILYVGQQSLERGAVPLEALSAFAEGSEEISIGQPEPTLLSNALLEDDSLLTGAPCGAPCWQNIIPGETTLDEARTIVEQLATAEITQEADAGFAFTMGSGVICCQISSQDGVTVSTIFLQLAPTQTLGQVLEAHGEPTFVTGEPFSENEYIMTLFYPDMTSLVYTVVDGMDGQLSEDSPIFTVIYATSDLMDMITSTTPLDDWKGLLTYSEYMDGEFDNMP